jgi:serine/threonine-protein kinase
LPPLPAYLDAFCVRFEAACKAAAPGEPLPRLEDYLGETSPPDRLLLLQELVALEVAYRCRRGEEPVAAAYRERFPDLDPAWVDQEIQAASTAAKGVPEAAASPPRAQQIDCPRCHNPIQLAESQPDEVLCPGCGSRLRVRKQLEKHGNDARQSLAAVDLVHVSNAEERLTSEQTGPYRPPSTQPPQCRFQILRPLKRGGLGEVFVARDVELQREVALKEIQERHAHDPESRARFLLEAEVTGGLEHPGIVPVYGLGAYADGRPFYAMRLIKGDSLEDAITGFHTPEGEGSSPGGFDGLPFRQLLGRFVSVCNAVAYAHSRGVLHRDLKPANILLGKYGETLVVDWGLAKAAGRSEAARSPAETTLRPTLVADLAGTQVGAVMGTPAYMSPEQAAGQLDQLGPRSDVYSLGATLYCLLTGQAPFPGKVDLRRVLRKVQRGTFSPPHQVNRQVPAALEAVCLRAMAREPQKRYATAADLAQDVERWLADEPVKAYSEPLTVRLTRWARRHQTGLRATAAVLILAVVVLAVSTWLIWREQKQTTAQKQDAERGWARAEENANVARGLAVTLNDAAEKRLSGIPQAETFRRDMTDMALDTFRQFLRQRPDDPQLQEQTARLYRYSANVHGSLNDIAGAEQSFREAIRLLDALVVQVPEEPSYSDQLAETLRDQSQLLAKVGRLSDGAAALDRSVAIARRLQAAYPGHAPYMRTLAISLLNLSGNYHSQGRFAESLAHAEEAVELMRRLPAAAVGPAHPYDGLHLAIMQLHVGIAQRELGRSRDALATHSQTLEQLKKLLGPGDNRDVQHYLGRALVEHGRTLLELKERLPQAEADFTQAIQIWEDLQKRFADSPLYREFRSGAYEARARARTGAGHPGPADEDLARAQTILVELVKKFPEVPRYHGRLGRVYAARGRLALGRGDARQADGLLANAILALGRSLKGAPEQVHDRIALKEAEADQMQARKLLPPEQAAPGDRPRR